MKKWILIGMLLSFSSIAGDKINGCATCAHAFTGVKSAGADTGSNKLTRAVVSSGKIIDDADICSPIERNKFKEFTHNLKEIYGTTLKDSYFEIECNGNDLLGIIVDSPAGSYMASLHMQKYFEKDEGIPEMFSHILLNEVNTRNILDRIEIELNVARRNDNLRGSIVEKRLVKMKTKYTAYLKKYPVD